MQAPARPVRQRLQALAGGAGAAPGRGSSPSARIVGRRLLRRSKAHRCPTSAIQLVAVGAATVSDGRRATASRLARRARRMVRAEPGLPRGQRAARRERARRGSTRRYLSRAEREISVYEVTVTDGEHRSVDVAPQIVMPERSMPAPRNLARTVGDVTRGVGAASLAAGAATGVGAGGRQAREHGQALLPGTGRGVQRACSPTSIPTTGWAPPRRRRCSSVARWRRRG